MIILLPILLIITVPLINGLLGPYLKKIKIKHNNPKVSVLIPAKNEVERISNCLETILNQDYDNYTVTVLDDQSTDGTYNFLSERYSSKIKIIKGEDRPDGWVGKNWACNQLAEQADGDILIFTDADNSYSRDAISKSVSAMKKYDLDMLSVFPENITKSFSEKVFTGIVDIIIYSLLPLWLTLLSRNSSLAAANGQWLAIKRKTYFEIGGHKSVKETNVEDIALARKLKKENKKILVLSGIDTVFVRMYNNFQEIYRGYSKNMYQMLGGNIPAFIANLFLFSSFLIGMIYPDYNVNLLSISLLLVWFLILRSRFKKPLLSVVFYPAILAFMVIVGIKSIFKQNKQIQWR
jgi:chlorobactene glucosyltransferase